MTGQNIELIDVSPYRRVLRRRRSNVVLWGAKSQRCKDKFYSSDKTRRWSCDTEVASRQKPSGGAIPRNELHGPQSLGSPRSSCKSWTTGFEEIWRYVKPFSDKFEVRLHFSFMVHDGTWLEQPHVAWNTGEATQGANVQGSLGLGMNHFWRPVTIMSVQKNWERMSVVYYKLFSKCSTVGLQALVGAYETLRNPEKWAAEEMQQRVTNTTGNEIPTIVEKRGETCFAPFSLTWQRCTYDTMDHLLPLPYPDSKIPLRRQEYDESQRGPKEFFLLTAHRHNETSNGGMPLHGRIGEEWIFETIFSYLSVKTAILFGQARQISSLRQLVVGWIQKCSPSD